MTGDSEYTIAGDSPGELISLPRYIVAEIRADRDAEIVQALRERYNHGLGHLQTVAYNHPADFVADLR